MLPYRGSARSLHLAFNPMSPRQLKSRPRSQFPKPEPFPGFVAPQLAVPVKSPPSGQEWIHELKLDGYRMQLQIEQRSVRLLTRNGLDWFDRYTTLVPALQALARDSKASAGLILDGELVVCDPHGRSDFSQLQRYPREPLAPGYTIVYFVFDMLYFDGHSLQKLPLLERKHQLQKLLQRRKQSAIQYVDHVADSGTALLEQCKAWQLEGIVSKRSDRPYQSGRHHDWTKCKTRERETFLIGGYELSAGPRPELSSLLVGHHDSNNKLRFAGRVGTGWSHDEHDQLLSS